MLTADQTKGILERVAYAVVMILTGKLVASGYISADDAAWIAGGAVALVGGTYGWIVNRPKALMQTASQQIGADGTKPVIVASPELASSTPESNIVSNTSTAAAIAGAVTDVKADAKAAA